MNQNNTLNTLPAQAASLVRYYSADPFASLKASRENYLADVLLAKRQTDRLAVVIRAQRRNQARPLFCLGYARFGCAPVWVRKGLLGVPGVVDLWTLTPDELRAMVAQLVGEAIQAADETEAARH